MFNYVTGNKHYIYALPNMNVLHFPLHLVCAQYSVKKTVSRETIK